MSDDPRRDEILDAGPDDGDWTDVLHRTKRAHRRYQVRAAVLLTALVVVSAASAYALTHRGQPWCKVPPNNAWKKTLAGHVVALSRHASVTPLAVANDGRSFYATLVSKSYSGIVRIDARTSRYTKIQRIPRPSMFRAVGSADGRWFVWVDTWRDVMADPDYPKWEIWSWDSRTGRTRELFSEPDAGRHADWLSISTFSVRDGYAVWAQSGPAGGGFLHAVDLSNGRNRVIHRGAVLTEPLLLPAHVVVWGEQTWGTAGKNVELTAVNAVTGKRVALPPSIRSLRGNAAASLTTDGGAFVYSKELPGHSLWRSSALWWSPSFATKPWRVFNFQRGIVIAQIAGRYVYFRTETFNKTGTARSSGYLVDATDGGYVKTSSNPGEVLLNSKALVLKDPVPRRGEISQAKAAQAITDVTFLPTKSFPAIRSCPSR